MCIRDRRVDSENLFVLSETRLGDVLDCVQQEQPDILIVDSIQTLYNEELDAPAGGVGQVKDCTMALMHDPDVNIYGNVLRYGIDMGAYPAARTYMFDLKLTF